MIVNLYCIDFGIWWTHFTSMYLMKWKLLVWRGVMQHLDFIMWLFIVPLLVGVLFLFSWSFFILMKASAKNKCLLYLNGIEYLSKRIKIFIDSYRLDVIGAAKLNKKIKKKACTLNCSRLWMRVRLFACFFRNWVAILKQQT